VGGNRHTRGVCPMGHDAGESMLNANRQIYARLEYAHESSPSDREPRWAAGGERQCGEGGEVVSACLDAAILALTTCDNAAEDDDLMMALVSFLFRGVVLIFWRGGSRDFGTSADAQRGIDPVTQMPMHRGVLTPCLKSYI